MQETRRRRQEFGPGLGRSPWGENGSPLQHSCLKNSMDRGAEVATVHGVTKSRTRLSVWACVLFKLPLFIISSVTQSRPTLCDPMDCSTPGFPVHHQLLELIQTHVHPVGDGIQPSHPLASASPPTFNPSQHQGLMSQFFTSGGLLH